MIKQVNTGLALVLLTSAGIAWGQAPQPDAMTLAQAYDRCMTTYAVRLTRTDVTDDAIFQTATESCRELQTSLFAALRAERSSEEAEAIVVAMTEQAQPNFQSMLDRIRSDRAARATQ
jgi:hypothetical protein